MPASKCVKMIDIDILYSLKLFSHKIGMTEKFCNFHTLNLYRENKHSVKIS